MADQYGAFQPIMDLANKVSNFASKLGFTSSEQPPQKTVSGPKPTAKQLGWADQTNMRKISSDNTKVAPPKAAPINKAAPRKRIPVK